MDIVVPKAYLKALLPCMGKAPIVSNRHLEFCDYGLLLSEPTQRTLVATNGVTAFVGIDRRKVLANQPYAATLLEGDIPFGIHALSVQSVRDAGKATRKYPFQGPYRKEEWSVVRTCSPEVVAEFPAMEDVLQPREDILHKPGEFAAAPGVMVNTIVLAGVVKSIIGWLGGKDTADWAAATLRYSPLPQIGMPSPLVWISDIFDRALTAFWIQMPGGATVSRYAMEDGLCDAIRACKAVTKAVKATHWGPAPA